MRSTIFEVPLPEEFVLFGVWHINRLFSTGRVVCHIPCQKVQAGITGGLNTRPEAVICEESGKIYIQRVFHGFQDNLTVIIVEIIINWSLILGISLICILALARPRFAEGKYSDNKPFVNHSNKIQLL